MKRAEIFRNLIALICARGKFSDTAEQKNAGLQGGIRSYEARPCQAGIALIFFRAPG